MKKIFIIDDDEMSIFVTKRSLKIREVNAEINSFLNAEEALEILSKPGEAEQPDIIFLDLNMPIMDGWEFLEQLEAISTDKGLKNYHIYILTSSLDPADARKAKENDLVKGFIHKPIKTEDIEVVLQSF